MALAAAIAFFSCKGPEPVLEPAVFKLNPSGAMAESGFAHELEVSLYCDVDFRAEMSGGTWTRIVSQMAGTATNVSQITIALETNGTGKPRGDTLEVSAGTKTLRMPIVQRPASESVSSTDVVLEYTRPSTVTVNLPSDWSLDMGSSAWLEYAPASGRANTPATITFKAKSLNFESSGRVAKGRLDTSGQTLDFTVTQNPSAPEGAFAESVYGIYNYDGNGANLVYDPFRHQTNLVKGPSGNIFRLVDPAGNTFYEISDLPAQFAPSDSITFTMYQNWIPSLGYKTEVGAWVLKAEGSHVWLVGGNDIGFVIKR